MRKKRRLISLCIIFAYCFSIISPCLASEKASGYLRIVKTFPADGSTTGTVGEIKVQFNLPVDMETVNLFTFVVKTADQKNPIFGKISSADSRTIRFVPSKAFEAGKNYTVSLYPDIKTNGGLALAAKHSFSFTFAEATTEKLEKTAGTKETTAKKEETVKPEVPEAVVVKESDAKLSEVVSEKKPEPVVKADKESSVQAVKKSSVSAASGKEPKLPEGEKIAVTDCNIRGKKLSADSTIIVTFNTPLDEKSLKEKTLLWNENKKDEKIRIHYMKSLNKLVVKPAVDFKVGKEYAFILEKGLKSAGGNGLDDDVIFVFTAMPVSGKTDLGEFVQKIKSGQGDLKPESEKISMSAQTSDKESREQGKELALSSMLDEITAEEVEKNKIKQRIFEVEKKAIEKQRKIAGESPQPQKSNDPSSESASNAAIKEKILREIGQGQSSQTSVTAKNESPQAELPVPVEKTEAKEVKKENVKDAAEDFKMQLQVELEKEKLRKTAVWKVEQPAVTAPSKTAEPSEEEKKKLEVREKLKDLLDKFKNKQEVPEKTVVQDNDPEGRKKEIESLKMLLTKLDDKGRENEVKTVEKALEKKAQELARTEPSGKAAESRSEDTPKEAQKPAAEISELLSDLEKSEVKPDQDPQLVSELLQELEKEKELVELKVEEEAREKSLTLDLHKIDAGPGIEIPDRDLAGMVKEIEEAKDLVVTSSNPESGSVIYDVKRPVEVFFSTSVDEKTLNPFNVKLSKGEQNIVNEIKYFPSHNKLTIHPVEPLEQGELYRITLSSDITSLTGKRLKQKEIAFRIQEAADQEGPEILDTLPRFGEENASVDTKVEVFFSEEIERRSLNVFSLTLFRDKKPIYGSVIYSKEEMKAVFIPETRLSHDTKYTAYIDKSIVDVKGNSMKSSFVWSFKTARKPDSIAPVVTRKTPESSEENVPVDARLDIEFSESISRDSVTPFSITLNDGLTNIICKYIVSENGRKVTAIPKDRLKFDTTYKAKVQNISDPDGNIMTSSNAWLFRTVAKPDTNPPVIIETSPKNNDVEVSVYSAISVKFSESLNPVPVNLGQFKLLNGRNELEIKVQYDKLQKSVQVIPVKGLEYGNEYTVIVKDGIEDITGNKLKAAHTFSFRTADREDLTPPAILAVYPEIGAENMDTDIQLSIVFDEPMDTRSIDAQTILLKDMKEEIVKGSMTYDNKLKTVSIKPDKPLINGMTYTVFVTNLVRDSAGNKMKSGVKWSFRTRSENRDYRAPEILSVSPVVDAKHVDPRSEISVAFNEKLNPETVNLFNFQLLSGSNKEDISLFYDDFLEIVVMKLKYPLAEGKEYTVTVNPGVADKNGNVFGKTFSWRFTTREQPEQEKLTDRTTVPQVINNYALIVSTSVPGQGENEVPMDSDIKLFVNNPLDASTLNSDSLFMIDEIGRGVEVKISFDSSQNRLLIRPLKKLSANLGYSVFLVRELVRDIYGNKLDEDYILNFRTYKAGSQGKIALLSEEMGIPQKIARKKIEADTNKEPPKPLHVSPANGATDVSISPKISVIFSSLMNSVTLNEHTVRLDNGSEIINGRVSYDDETRKVIFIPSSPLQQGKTYRLTLVQSIQDTSGNNLEKDVIYTFTTRDNTGPVVKSTVPLDGSSDVSVTAPLQAEFSKSVLNITLNPFTIKLFEQKTQNRVKGYIKYSATDSKLMFIPDKALKKGTEYLFRISEGIQDASGNFMNIPVEIKFVTEN